jgi:hypothetical protein
MTQSSDRLRELLIQIDCIVTGRPAKDAEHTARNQVSYFEDTIKFLTSGEYYLSDGGYSRLMLDELAGDFRLSSNSRDQVKAVWHSGAAKELVAEASRILMTILRDNDKDDALQP